MFSLTRNIATWGASATLALALIAPSAEAANYDEAKRAYDAGQWDKAIGLLKPEVESNPGNQVAWILLSEAYEAAKEWESAESTWKAVRETALTDEHRDAARRALIRLRRRAAEERDLKGLANPGINGDSINRNAFYIPMPEVPWKDIETVEDKTYENRVPRFHYESKHFDVFATNEKLAEVIAERAEIYLDFMTEHLFGGRAWGFRLPIFCYATEEDYISQGGAPQGSHGVTFGSILGKSQYVMLFHRLKVEDENSGEQEVMYKYAIESILPHELTHVMINEFFGGQEIPQWLHEAVAGRMEQTRDHYLEAARLARAVVAGEHFRMRDLFEQKGYPSSRIGLFYEQSAIVVLYLFEAGPDAMYTFFNELAQQKTHDQALSAALGIPEEGAVEEFERMWVEWMKRRYVQDLKPDAGEAFEAVEVDTIADSTLVGPPNELGAIEAITDWQSIPTTSMSDVFIGVSNTTEDWKAAGGSIRCAQNELIGIDSYLGIRTYLKRPLALKCTLRATGTKPDQLWAGFAVLDAAQQDTGISVWGKLEPNKSHDVTVLLGDELAMYVDGNLQGRYPVPPLGRLDAAPDYPVALVGQNGLEISDLRVAHVSDFDAPPVVEEEEGKDEDSSKSRGSTRGRGRGRR